MQVKVEVGSNLVCLCLLCYRDVQRGEKGGA